MTSHILLVTSNENLGTLAKTLRAQGYKVHLAETAEEVAEILKPKTWSLVSELCERRIALGYTQAELGKALDLSQALVSRMELRKTETPAWVLAKVRTLPMKRAMRTARQKAAMRGWKAHLRRKGAIR